MGTINLGDCGVWTGPIASRLAPTLELRATQNPCGSEPARDGRDSVSGGTLPVELQKLSRQRPDTIAIGAIRTPVIVDIRTQHQLEIPIVIKITSRCLVGNRRSFMKMQSYSFRRTVSGRVFSKDPQMPLFTFPGVEPGTFQIRFAEGLEPVTISLRCLAQYVFIFVKPKIKRVCLALPAYILCNHFQITHPCAPVRNVQTEPLLQAAPSTVSLSGVRQLSAPRQTTA
ncbi:hypothetical protein EMIT0P294_20511 [Pseudomonas sp. IT-P294]